MSPTRTPAKATAPRVQAPAPEVAPGSEAETEVIDNPETELLDPDVVDNIDDEVADEDEFNNLIMSLGLDFRFENRPGRTGRGRPPAVKVPWEKILDGLREYPDTDTRVRIFEGNESDSKMKSRAASMAREIRSRLFEQVPNEEWDASHRFDPNPTLDDEFDEDGNATGKKVKVSGPAWKVYAMFKRTLSAEETEERIAKREAMAQRLAEAKERAKAEG